MWNCYSINIWLPFTSSVYRGNVRIITFPVGFGEAKGNPGLDAVSFYEIKAMAPLCVCTEVCHMHKNKGKCYFNHKLEAGNKANKASHLGCFKRLMNEVPSLLFTLLVQLIESFCWKHRMEVKHCLSELLVHSWKTALFLFLLVSLFLSEMPTFGQRFKL